ncbi:MAG TPA: acyltransferase [Candidatus Acidoferrales bacterium]|nr:acyltransferase [Candidatus Acidoferrales bacterium]
MSYAKGRSWNLTRLPALDGLRGLAILMVLLCHLAFPLSNGAGAAGVTIFFVLSGFLITSLLVRGLQKGGRGHLPMFYFRRVRRLFPALLALLIFVTCVDLSTGDIAHIAGRVVPALFYFYNWICVNIWVGGDPIGQTWSLSIEEQFYLLWPFVLLIALRRGGPELALRIAIIGAVAAFVDRGVLFGMHASISRIYFGSDTNALPLMVGCALGLALSQGKLPRVPLIATAFAGVALFGVSVDTAYGGGIDFLFINPVVATAASAVLIGWIVTSGGGGALNWRASRGLGRISYSLYLWQTPVIVWGGDALGGYPLAIRVAVLGGTALLFAVASYRLVEGPIRRLGTTSVPPRPAPTLATG